MVWNFAGCRLLENVISKVIQPIQIIHLESKKNSKKEYLKNQITWLKPYSPGYSFAIYGFIATAIVTLIFLANTPAPDLVIKHLS